LRYPQRTPFPENAMNMRVAAACLAALCSSAVPGAFAQQAAPPSFAPPNLTSAGVRSMAANCAACHGTGGRAAADSALQGLAGRSKDELVAAMAAFRAGKRPATVMHQIAKGYGDDEIAAIADYFSRQPR
jgi:cytochrome subunit of sulfide dehydrogenase